MKPSHLQGILASRGALGAYGGVIDMDDTHGADLIYKISNLLELPFFIRVHQLLYKSPCLFHARREKS